MRPQKNIVTTLDFSSWMPNTDQSRTYNLDGLGNWKTSTFMPAGGSQSTDQRNHNYVNEITQRTLTGGSAVAFQYDGKTGGSNGNLKNDGTLIYAYDAFNRLIQVNRVSDGLIIATYVYDAMNRRVRKTIFNGGLTGNIPGSTTDYIWSGSQVVEERNAGNTPIRQYVWGTYIDGLIQLTTLVPLGPQNLSLGTYYLLQDLLFRAVALTNSSGAVVEAYDTDAYGNTLIFTGPGPDGVWFTEDDVQSSYGANEIIYCGYRFDAESELYYVRNRTYSPVLGRWIQRDPIGYAGGVNLYEYVGGRVPIRPDPTGKDPGSKDCCKNKNCCGADITLNLLLMAADVRAKWNMLSSWAKLELASATVVPNPLAINIWDICGMAQGGSINGAPQCQDGTGTCVGTVTVAGSCCLQGAVNYWLAGLIYNAMASDWLLTGLFAREFEFDVLVYTLRTPPVAEKRVWFLAGGVVNPAGVPAPGVYQVCKPCKVRPKVPLRWHWGFLHGSD